jgi:hypothetical protein
LERNKLKSYLLFSVTHTVLNLNLNLSVINFLRILAVHIVQLYIKVSTPSAIGLYTNYLSCFNYFRALFGHENF